MSHTTFLAAIPSPSQGVWHLGPLPIRAYALCIIIGIVVAVWWGDRRWQVRGGRSGEVLDVALWAVPFGLIGGRLYHVATDWNTYFGDGGKTPIDAFKIWDGGLGIWGAVALGALGAWIGTRFDRIKLPAFGDAIAPAILLAQAIGRLGNWFNQELYGRPTNLPWGLEIYERVDSEGRSGPGLINGVSNGRVLEVVQPTFLYELLWNVLVVVALVLIDRRFRIGHGRLFALYVAAYSFGRFFVEMLRDDHATLIFGIRINLFTAALIFILASVYVMVARKGRDRSAYRGNDEAADDTVDDDRLRDHDTVGDDDTVRDEEPDDNTLRDEEPDDDRLRDEEPDDESLRDEDTVRDEESVGAETAETKDARGQAENTGADSGDKAAGADSGDKAAGGASPAGKTAVAGAAVAGATAVGAAATAATAGADGDEPEMPTSDRAAEDATAADVTDDSDAAPAEAVESGETDESESVPASTESIEPEPEVAESAEAEPAEPEPEAVEPVEPEPEDAEPEPEDAEPEPAEPEPEPVPIESNSVETDTATNPEPDADDQPGVAPADDQPDVAPAEDQLEATPAGDDAADAESESATKTVAPEDDSDPDSQSPDQEADESADAESVDVADTEDDTAVNTERVAGQWGFIRGKKSGR